MVEEEGQKNYRKAKEVILPDLDADDILKAEDPNSLEWARDLVEYYNNGGVHRASQLGITLQVIKDSNLGSEGVRFIAAYDEEPCLTYLSMLRHTFEYAGFSVQIEPYLVLCKNNSAPPSSSPYLNPESSDGEDHQGVEGTNQTHSTQIGMEVV